MGGSSTQGNTYTAGIQQTMPWTEQIPYLDQMFHDQQNLYNTETSNPIYNGQQIAQTPKAGVDAFGNALNFANGLGNTASSDAINAGLGLFGTGQAGTNLATAGLGNFAFNDPTQGNINTANQYANNPYISQETDAAMQDARRQTYEQALPQIDKNAAANGTEFSSRQGIAQGLAERNLQEQAANTSAALRGNAWNTGLTAAQNGNQQQLSALGTLGSLGNSTNNTALNAINGGYTDNINNLNAATTASNGLANAQQNSINNAIAMSQYPYQVQQSYLNAEYNLIGNRSWGGETLNNQITNSYQQTNPSPLSTAGSVLGGLGGLMKCDARVKENIKRIGTFDNGLALYSFNYVGNPQIHIGPMAQEVEAIKPEAVIEINGIKHIDLATFVAL